MNTHLEAALKDLTDHIEGDVMSSYKDRLNYAVDESIFNLLPSIVVAPKHEEDLKAIVEIAHRYDVALTSRGGGSGVAGQSIGSGIVIDFKKYFNRVLDFSQNQVLVQPGVVLKDLNAELEKFGCRFAPDPGSWMTCTIGGMVATNASGPRGFRYGSTRDHVVDMKVCLADGTLILASDLEDHFHKLVSMLQDERDRIHAHWPLVRKNSSGYSLVELCHEAPSFPRFLVGSEGTLALTTEVMLKTIPIPKQTSLGVYGFGSINEALSFLTDVRGTSPCAIELLDNHILRALEKANSGILQALGLSESALSLWVEWDENNVKIPGKNAFVARDPSGRSNLWAIRSKASRYLHEQARKRQPLRCIEDTVVPIQYIETYVSELREILARHDCDGAIFGHIGDGHLHVNPNIDVTQPKLWFKIQALMDDVYDTVLRHGGSISGEHGDGILRSNYVKKQWRSLIDLFFHVKATFDPKNIFNPGKKLSRKLVVHPPLRRWS